MKNTLDKNGSAMKLDDIRLVQEKEEPVEARRENHLGKILMKVREELKTQSYTQQG